MKLFENVDQCELIATCNGDCQSQVAARGRKFELDHRKTGQSAKKNHRNEDNKDLSYEERLKRCGLTAPEKRRSRGDLIEACKSITENESIAYSGSGSLG